MANILDILVTNPTHSSSSTRVVSTRDCFQIPPNMFPDGGVTIPSEMVGAGLFIHDKDPHRQQTVFCEPSIIENLAAEQTIILNAFNQHYGRLTLTSVDIDGEGIAVEGLTSGVLIVGASKPYRVLLDVSIAGGVQGTITFNFIEVPPVVVQIAAVAYPVLWEVPPQTGMLKALEWKTSIIQTASTEQRLSVRAHPIINMSHRYLFSDSQLAYYRNHLEVAQGNFQSIPVWTDIHALAAPITGSNIVYFDTSLSYMRTGDTVIIFNDNGFTEQNSVLTVLGNGVVLANSIGLPTPYGFIGTVVYSRALSGTIENRNAQQNSIVSVSWYTEEYLPPVVEPAYDFYRGMMVVTNCRVMPNKTVSDTKKSELIVLRNNIGKVAVRQDSEWERDEYVLGFVFDSLLEERLLESFFHYIRGRQKQFFIPANISYLDIVAPLLSGASSILVTANSHTPNSVNRFIEMQLSSGEVIRFKILASEINGDGTETLTIDMIFSETIPIASILYTTELIPVRLNSDRVEFSYREVNSGNVVVTAVTCPVATDQPVLNN